MILAAMIAYYVVAIGLIVLVGYVTYRQGVRRMQAASEAAMARMQAEFGRFPPLEPYVREPLTGDLLQGETEARLAVSIVPTPNTPPEQVAVLSLRLFEVLNKIALANGGAGLSAESHRINV
ncbi:hypothetical protein [Frigoriglobus tundricola]|uniref:Uncharacterized protein n=1 Tax=Frigoriglobus tundricola TaxID=2774151 RepID=A0A6M5YI73_9BACT|nr:hypothetical protein [Frigoriglobus tundricola]QJW92662.1 hypothetical protein FTUN_0159 [Frigoriglobus tundricola]